MGETLPSAADHPSGYQNGKINNNWNHASHVKPALRENWSGFRTKDLKPMFSTVTGIDSGIGIGSELRGGILVKYYHFVHSRVIMLEITIY